MKIYSVFDDEFRPYGRVVPGFADEQLLSAMCAVPMPAQGTAYEPAIPALEACDVYAWFRDSAFGGMPVQNLHLIDIGKPETLCQAEEFLKTNHLE